MDKTPTLVTPDLINLYNSAGFDARKVYGAKTVDMVGRNCENDIDYKSEIRKQLRIMDEQTAINRYKWYNLPNGMTGQLLERLLYYKAQLTYFYSPIDNKMHLLPYALSGDIDELGRYERVVGIPLAGASKDKGLAVYDRKVIYDFEDIDEKTFANGCVILRDYTNQYGETNIPRQILQEPLLDAMAEAIPFARTSQIASCGVSGQRVADEDCSSNVEASNRAMKRAALQGKPFVPIVGPIEFQNLTNKGQPTDMFSQYMQFLDNYRLSLYGLKNGGLFEKNDAYVNNIQASNSQNNVGFVYQDGLTIRQQFCDLVNAIWGLGIWCEASEVASEFDVNGDGQMLDNQDQSGIPNEQPEGGNEDANI